jgi:hypothetical protein
MEKKEFEPVIIDGIEYHPCKLCLDAFGRVRLTKYYCDKCGNYMCMGEHGNFAQGKKGTCVICGERPYYRGKAEE